MMDNALLPLWQTIWDYQPLSRAEQRDRQEMLDILQAGGTPLTRSQPDHFTASAWVCSADRSHILMAYHNIYGAWAWLGGHADGEADLLAVARREAEEETGVQRLRLLCSAPISLEILPVAAHIRRGEPVAAHRHLNLTYLFEAAEDQRLENAPAENSAVGWRAVTQVLPGCNEQLMIPVYQKLLERMLRY